MHNDREPNATCLAQCWLDVKDSTFVLLFNFVYKFGLWNAKALNNSKKMLHCTPFLLFDGNCAEAMAFYHECFGGELTLTKLGDSPMKDMFPTEKHARIINANLKSGDIVISATDWMASPEFEPIQGNTFAIFVIGKTYEELKIIFDKLRDGNNNKRLQELHELPFGIYGQFYDKYDIQWIFKGTKKE